MALQATSSDCYLLHPFSSRVIQVEFETPAKALSIFSPPWMGNFLSEPAGRVRYRIENRLEFALQPPPCGASSPALQAFLSFFRRWPQ